MSTELLKIAEDSARGGFFLISGSILATLISAIATIVVARLLGPELYGQYALALVIPTLLFLIADVGINQGIIKFSASLRT
ncbi:MAG: oligosaccharide flippase family protein, partial [Anaerolineales bacterium]|nr:oligosaccharide flippase family protein [Anaerolineales bacterium]